MQRLEKEHQETTLVLMDPRPREDKLFAFTEENELLVMNTFFELHPRRLYTWKSLKDGKDGVIIRLHNVQSVI